MPARAVHSERIERSPEVRGVGCFMSLSLSDPTTGWSFTLTTDAAGTRPTTSGLTLTDVRHDGHNFCRDLRVIGLRIVMERVRPDGSRSESSHFLPLSDPPFVVSPLRVIRPSVPTSPSPPTVPAPPSPSAAWLREAADALRFQSYFASGVFGVRCEYTLPSAYVAATWPNCEVERLEVSQQMLFSPRGNAPKHEPSGGLHAARCHPLTRFEWVPNRAVDRSRDYFRVLRTRIDYRLHLFIDRHHASPDAAPSLGNNAGLFADNESLNPFAAAGAGIGNIPGLQGRTGLGPASTSSIAFAAVEKPLVREVATLGLEEGTRLLGPRSRFGARSAERGWDNVHWWGSRGAGAPMISAPGAFHAAHIHWRWGGAGSSLPNRPYLPEIDGTGGPAGFATRFWGSDRLQVDPNIWMQTLRIGVTKNEPALNPNHTSTALESLCTERWEELFTRLRSAPADIEAGEDIVLWYSADVPRETTFPADVSSGIFPTTLRPGVTYSSSTPASVFIHGIFFAHDAEQTNLYAGTTDPQHSPRTPAEIRALTGPAAWRRTSS